MFKPQEITTLTSAKICVCYIKLLNVSITEVGIAVDKLNLWTRGQIR